MSASAAKSIESRQEYFIQSNTPAALQAVRQLPSVIEVSALNILIII
jgi:hypothetical protein